MSPAEFSCLMRMRGWVLFDAIIEASFAETLAHDLETAYEVCRAIQRRNGLAAETGGTAHHLLGLAGSFAEFLRRRFALEHVEAWLGGRCVLNSYGGVLNPPGEQAYVQRVHRDVRTYSADLPLMLNMLVMLDDFTEANGATYVLTGSHRLAEKPSDELFYRYCDRLVGKRGSIALWDSNLWHAAGRNQTAAPRRALTLTFTRPFVKPQLDYTRALAPDCANQLDDATRQLLGFHARVPASLDEWYQPPERRFYRSDQG